MCRTDSIPVIKYKGQTGGFLSVPLAYKMGQTFVRLDLQTTLADSFRLALKSQSNTIKLQDYNISSYQSDIKIKQNIIDNDLKMIGIYKDLDKKSQRKIKSLKLQRNVLAIVVIATLGKIFLFH